MKNDSSGLLIDQNHPFNLMVLQNSLMGLFLSCNRQTQSIPTILIDYYRKIFHPKVPIVFNGSLSAIELKTIHNQSIWYLEEVEKILALPAKDCDDADLLRMQKELKIVIGLTETTY